MRRYIVFVITLVLLVLIQHWICKEQEHAVNDDHPRRRTAKDHTLRLVSEEYKTRDASTSRLTISRLKTEMNLKAYDIKLGCLFFFDLIKEYITFECSIYNSRIPSSFQRIQVDNSQERVNRMIKRLPVEKRKEGTDIRSNWVDACLEYGSKVTALSRTHADEWNELINSRLITYRIYSDIPEYDKIGQLFIDAVIEKDTLEFKDKILRLSRKQKKEIHCLSPPEVPMKYDVALKSIYNHFSNIQAKLFGNTQYYMASYLVMVSTQVSQMAGPSYPTSLDSKYMSPGESVSSTFKSLEKSLQYIWVNTPERTLPYNYFSDPGKFFVNLLKFVWDWFINSLKKCIENENTEKKKLISVGVDLII